MAQRRQKDQGIQDEESTNWGKVEQAAQEAANPQGKSKKAIRKLLKKLQAWGAQAHCRPWEQPVGVWWHMEQEQQALSWVYGGVTVDAEVKAFLVPELQQPDGDKRLYDAARAEAKAVTRQSGWQTVSDVKWSGDTDGHTGNGGTHGVVVQGCNWCSCSSHKGGG